MQKKLVSICVPTYVQTQFLKSCLDSVFRQTYTNYELIVSDDTPDNSLKKFLERQYPNKPITYHRNTPALGSPANWNFAISQAKGEYIKLLHHDDYFTFENSLEKFVNFLDKNVDCDFVFSLSQVHNNTDGSLRITEVSPAQIEQIKHEPTRLINGNFMGSPSATLYRKTTNTYDEKLKWLVDIDYYINALLKNNNVGFISQPLITTINEAQHQVTNSCLNNPEVELFEYCYLLDKYKKNMSSNQELKRVFLNLFYNYGISHIDQLKPYYKAVNQQAAFYESVFKVQWNYNLKRKTISKLKSILGKTI